MRTALVHLMAPCWCALLLAQAPASPAWAQSAGAAAAPAVQPAGAAVAAPSAAQIKAASSAVNKLIAAIRYKKDAIAGRQLGFATMTQALMGPQLWAQMSQPQRAEATAAVAVLVRQASFERGREAYGYIDAVRFTAGQASQQGAQLHLPSTVVVHRELKKIEMAVTWVLQEEEGAWKVVDTRTGGDSLCAGIYEDQVAPLAKKGGLEAVLGALRTKAAAATGQP